MTNSNDTGQELIEMAANCSIYEADKFASPSGLAGAVLGTGAVKMANLDRDFYAQDFASQLSSPEQAIEALEASKPKRVIPLLDVDQWRAAFKIEGDEIAVADHWEAHNRVVAQAIAQKAGRLLEIHDGHVDAPNPLAGLFGKN